MGEGHGSDGQPGQGERQTSALEIETTNMTSSCTTSTSPKGQSRKRFFNRLQAIITSPKRVIAHAERDGLLHGRRRESISSHGSSAGSPTSPGGHHRTVSNASSSGRDRANSGLAHSFSPLVGNGSAEYDDVDEVVQEEEAQLGNKREHVKQEVREVKDSVKSKLRNGDASHIEQQAEQTDPGARSTQEPQSQQPEVLIRPHLRVRIVTWNMHDSLPTGDLSELLGHPNATATSHLDGAKPLEPDHPVKHLAATPLDRDAPYHIIVVGGQEVPVGHGGWSGPNWTEIIQHWLSEQAGQESNDPSASVAQQEPVSPGNRQAESTGQGDKEDDVTPEAKTPLAHDFEKEELSPAALDSGDKKLKALSKSVNGHAYDENLLSPKRASLQPPFMERGGSMHSNHSIRSTSTQSNAVTSASMVSTNSNSSGETATTADTSPPGAPLRQDASRATAAEEDDVVGNRVSPYVLVAKERLMGIYCSVWVWRECQDLVTGSSTGTVTAGLLAGKLGNKGAACVSMMIANTRLLFVCAHLAAHSERSNARQQNVEKIKKELVIDTFREGDPFRRKKDGEGTDDKDAGRGEDRPKILRRMSRQPEKKDKELEKLALESSPPEDGEDITDRFDYTFWFGDLNFRLDISRLHADFLIKQKEFETALTFDQLRPILKEEKGCFRGFHESPIAFPPSYKYDVLKLKRTKTLQRSNTMLGNAAPSSDRKALARMSAPAQSAAASKTTLPIGEQDEQEEDDLEQDRRTLSSSRASVSSAWSGFETLFDDEGNPIHPPPAMSTSHHSVGGLFGYGIHNGTSSPGTPTHEKVLDKAKNLLNFVRPKSSTPSTPAVTLDKSQFLSPADPNARNHTAPPPSPHIETGDFNLEVPYGASSTSLLPESTPRGELLAAPPLQYTAMQSTSSLSHAGSAPPVLRTDGEQTAEAQPSKDLAGRRPNTPRLNTIVPSNRMLKSPDPAAHEATSPRLARPRLWTSRSSATILSVNATSSLPSPVPDDRTPSQIKRDYENRVEKDAVFDTSSKKRVQSWTDRILYKSTIIPPSRLLELQEQQEAAQLAQADHKGMGSALLDSLRGVRRSFVATASSSGHHIAHSFAPMPTPTVNVAQVTDTLNPVRKRPTARVSFQQQESTDLPRVRTTSPADPTAGTAPPLVRRSSSRSSLGSHATPGSQQRLNHRFAKLFNRVPKTSPEQLEDSPGSPLTAGAASPDASTVQLAPGPRLNRSNSSQSRYRNKRLFMHRKHSNPLPGPVHIPIGETSPSSTPLSPLTVKTTASQATTIRPSTSPGALSFSPSQDDALNPTGGRPRAMSADHTSATGYFVSPALHTNSSPLTRAGSAPHHDGGRVSIAPSGNLPVMYEGSQVLSPVLGTMPEDDGKIKTALNSFLHPLKHTTTTSTSIATTPPGGFSASQGTGIPLATSKTMPITSNPVASAVQPTTTSSGLRQWFNSHRLLPFLTHTNDPVDLSSPAEPGIIVHEPDESFLSPTPEPPKPVIIGPERGEIHCIAYDSIADLRRMQACSDHRPVIAVFAVGI